MMKKQVCEVSGKIFSGSIFVQVLNIFYLDFTFSALPLFPLKISNSLTGDGIGEFSNYSHK